MSNLHQQWIALIKETRSWIEQKWEEGCRFTYTDQKPLPKTDKPKLELEAIAIQKDFSFEKPQVQNQTEVEQEFKEEKKHKNQPVENRVGIEDKQEEEKSNWALNPMPLPESDEAVHRSFGAIFKGEKLVKPHVPVILLLPTDHPAHRLFLENVARAITYTKSPARVMIAETLPLKEPSVKLILAPYTLMQKHYADLEIHCFYPVDGVTLLPLAKIESYLEDINLKHTLWNTLKKWHFPNTRQSSST
ncbi:MAG: hypothetical protein WAM28_06505 [Chlamydiales bacterium]